MYEEVQAAVNQAKKVNMSSVGSMKEYRHCAELFKANDLQEWFLQVGILETTSLLAFTINISKYRYYSRHVL